MNQYYLRVNCDKLIMNILISIATTKFTNTAKESVEDITYTIKDTQFTEKQARKWKQRRKEDNRKKENKIFK